MGKENVMHVYNGMLPVITKNKITPFTATWMDLEIITLSEVSQTEKHHMTSLVCGKKWYK